MHRLSSAKSKPVAVVQFLQVGRKEPIMPGEKGEFKVKFNTRNKVRKQHKVVTVYANTKEGKETVSFSAYVIPDPKMEKLRKERREKWRKQREARKRFNEKRQERAELNERNINVAREMLTQW